MLLLFSKVLCFSKGLCFFLLLTLCSWKETLTRTGCPQPLKKSWWAPGPERPQTSQQPGPHQKQTEHIQGTEKQATGVTAHTGLDRLSHPWWYFTHIGSLADPSKDRQVLVQKTPFAKIFHVPSQPAKPAQAVSAGRGGECCPSCSQPPAAQCYFSTKHNQLLIRAQNSRLHCCYQGGLGLHSFWRVGFETQNARAAQTPTEGRQLLQFLEFFQL